MTRFLLSASVAILTLAPFSARAAESLPLTHVTLSTSGLAQFEYQGKISGNQDLTFPVRLDQVDDVLKSLVVLDNGGSFGGVSLPGREPLAQTFRDLPFKQGDLSSPQALLNAMQGASVQMTDNGTTVSGRLVSVTEEQSATKDGDIITRHRVGVMAKDGLHTAVLEDLKNLSFTDPSVQAQIDKALAAIQQHSVQDQRTITLDLRGDGTRAVAVSYVTAAPLWKTAYRLVIPDNQNGKAYLQGWAILENTTGQDWTDVAVTLLSGNPVTYRQPLYESYYLDRPFLPLQVMGRLMPRTDTGGMALTDKKAAFGGMPPQPPGAPMRQMGMRANGVGSMMAMAKTANMPMAAAAPAIEETDADEAVSSEMQAEPATLAAAPTSVAEQTAAQMAFNFPQKISLAAGSSLMLPIVSRNLPGEQVDLYQPETDPAHPLLAVSLKNDSGTALPPGILTLFSQRKDGLRYTGDSELALFPKGESRYATFALDPAVRIDRVQSSDKQYGTFSAAKGTVTQRVISSATTTYTIKAPEDEGRTVVIEQPRRDGWDLKIPEGLAGDPEKTGTAYRLKLALKPGETKTLKVEMTHPEYEVISLGYMSPDDLAARITAVGDKLDDKTKDALQKAVELQNDVYAFSAQLTALDQERQGIYNDQQRVRQNLQSIPSNSDLAKRYLGDLNDQETRVQDIDKQYGTLKIKEQAARKKLTDYIQTLSF